MKVRIPNEIADAIMRCRGFKDRDQLVCHIVYLLAKNLEDGNEQPAEDSVETGGK